jgi:hypothetical protein
MAGDVMLPVVVWLHACQELRMELLEAMRANPGDAGLHAQFDQAAHDVVVMMAELRALEAVGLRCPVAAVASAVVLASMFRFELWPMCLGCAIGCNKSKFSIEMQIFLDTLQTLFAYTILP